MKKLMLVLCGATMMAQASVESWIDACEQKIDAVHGFVIMQHGKVVAEGSWKPFDTLNKPHMLYSHSKAFISTGIGFLVDDGKLDLDERVIDIFADKVPATSSDNLRQLRVRDLLTMNMGAKKTDAECNDVAGDWEKAILANTIDFAPGTNFRYDSACTYLLSCIIERKSGKRTMDFLRERLFIPLGITTAWSTVSPSGTACGGWGMNMTTRELAKFGQLYLQRGMWQGKRILSDEWVTLASARQTWSGAIAVAGEDGSDWHQGYGFKFWRCRHGAYRADGANGQLTIVVPQYDAVISVHAGLSDMQLELNLIWEHLLPALKEGITPNAALAAKCAQLAWPTVKGAAGGAEFCGKTYEFAPNSQGIKNVKFEAAQNGWKCYLTTAAGVQEMAVGYGEWARGKMIFNAEPYEGLGKIIGTHEVVASAAVTPQNTFNVEIRLLNAPQKLTFTLATDKLLSAHLHGIGGGKLIKD